MRVVGMRGAAGWGGGVGGEKVEGETSSSLGLV